MKALYDKGFPTPTPIDVNRHCVLMSLSHAYQLNSIAVLRHPVRVRVRARVRVTPEP